VSTNIRRTKAQTGLHAEVETEEQGFLLEPERVEMGTGYTIKIDYDQQDNQIVSIKTYGKVDLTKIKHEIKKAFPEAQIKREARIITIAKKNLKKTKRNKRHI
jgi:hypothetical protein